MNRFPHHFLSRLEPHILISGLIILGCVFGFMHLAGQVRDHDHMRFDKEILLAFRTPDDLSDPIGPPIVEEYVIDISALGSTPFMTILTAVMLGVLLLRRQYGLAFFILVCIGTGTALSVGLKLLYARDRPDLVSHMATFSFSSFPSGHVMSASIVYLTLGTLIMDLVSSRILKIYIYGWLFFVLFALGVSRVYLGVHWPSDVIAGWMVGIGWSLACWALQKKLRIGGKRMHGDHHDHG